MKKEVTCSSGTSVDFNGVKSQRREFFIITAVRTSNCTTVQ
jgi:hypothetical protein